jgi:4-hydroxy-tetrahydrodipicolinate synthase
VSGRHVREGLRGPDAACPAGRGVGPAQLGTAGYLFETPQRPLLTEYWDLILNDKLVEAMDYARESGMDQFDVDVGSWFTCYPGRSD